MRLRINKIEQLNDNIESELIEKEYIDDLILFLPNNMCEITHSNLFTDIINDNNINREYNIIIKLTYFSVLYENDLTIKITPNYIVTYSFGKYKLVRIKNHKNIIKSIFLPINYINNFTNDNIIKVYDKQFDRHLGGFNKVLSNDDLSVIILDSPSICEVIYNGEHVYVDEFCKIVLRTYSTNGFEDGIVPVYDNTSRSFIARKVY